ncbi:MAG TPA: NAD(P)H-dependent oxidoreductase subunit E [Polyangia bacterium]|nr:NAD(P)H-dependent oxidoreductase subunit E [Polyangia bacterium]
MSLIRELLALQEEKGWLSEPDLRALAQRLRAPLYRLQGLVSFYPHFRSQPPPGREIGVCRDLPCLLRGAPDLLAQLRAAAGSGVEVRAVSCLGRCDAAPACAVNEVPVAPADARVLTAPLPAPADEPAARARRFQIDPYDSPADRYGVLAAAPAAEAVIAELSAAGLRGMGGAGFPTGQKWGLVRAETRTPKYVICNADESEPGTFKDRVLLAEAPHLVLEGMALAGRMVGAERAILYIRHEYAPERRALERELDAATAAGKLRGFPIEIFVSPGGYILGEETALLEALEDRRGEPRNKPPFPGTHGLHGLPTLINNVETLAMVPAIIGRGSGWWKAQGVRGCAGLKLIAVSGDVARPGVYEIQMGTTVAELIERAGGVAGGRRLLAFAPGGASSNFLPAAQADVALDFAALAKAGSMLGSGALVVLAEGRDLLAVAENVTHFFARESCGKCVPCRVGSEKGALLLAARGDGLESRLAELDETLRLTSICGLGQVALGPALSILRNFRA